MIASQPDAPRRWWLPLLLLAAAAVFALLGGWQVQRLAWKQALIARVQARIHAAPVAPPGRDAWHAVNAIDHEYLRVRLVGALDGSRTTLVLASTALGPGYWVMTPLHLEDGSFVWINRGFVAERVGAAIPPVSTIVGLLRLSEPHGPLWRRNDPAAGRWISRDVDALCAFHRLPDCAPYFVDAQADPGDASVPAMPDEASARPVAGLTVVDFPNHHLQYAITWFALCAMSLAGIALALRRTPG